ncbi:MAG TPA: MFS transporter [Pseudonocardiaceae bacterium]|nr:MFS transporter [Pseudonocardiaceae bacterium]
MVHTETAPTRPSPVARPRPAPPAERRRWLALATLCLGTLMIVLDTTIVNVALPSIGSDLHLAETSLAWVVNAYLLIYGGFLLLGGRLGDLFGHRRLFGAGIAVFSLASLGCGLAGTEWVLIGARAVQGLGGAVVSAVSLSLIMNLFPTSRERAKAMGVYGFVAAGGGSVGVLLGGVLTDLLNWHAIFLVNVPIGGLVLVLSFRLLPTTTATAKRRLDTAGAVTITAALVAAVYAIVNGNTAGWTSAQTLGLLAGAVVLLFVFGAVERRVAAPLIPLSLLRVRNVAAANAVGMLWSAAMFAWFFLCALYLQNVLGYQPLEVGLAFLPGNVLTAALSLGISAKLVLRYGIRRPLAIGLGLVGVGLLLLAGAPVGGHYLPHVLPAMILLGVGAGLALNPVLLAAMSDVDARDSGLASGITNTGLMMGAALGLAGLASLASSRTAHVAAQGGPTTVALTAGYHTAFLVSAALAIAAAIIGAVAIRTR